MFISNNNNDFPTSIIVLLAIDVMRMIFISTSVRYHRSSYLWLIFIDIFNLSCYQLSIIYRIYDIKNTFYLDFCEI